MPPRKITKSYAAKKKRAPAKRGRSAFAKRMRAPGRAVLKKRMSNRTVYRSHDKDMKIIGPKRPHHVGSLTSDRDHVIFDSHWEGEAAWPQVGLVQSGTNYDGFVVSASTPYNVWVGSASTYGLPDGQVATFLIDWQGDGTVTPRGLTTELLGFSAFYVTKAVMTMTITAMNASPTEGDNSPVELGITPMNPQELAALNIIGSGSNSHYTYPPLSDAEESLSQLRQEPQYRARRAMMANTGGKPTCTVKAIFDSNKKMPIGWYNDPTYWNTTPSGVLTPPVYTKQGGFFVQLYGTAPLGGSGVALHTHIHIKYYCTMFNKRLTRFQTFAIEHPTTGKLIDLTSRESKEESKNILPKNLDIPEESEYHFPTTEYDSLPDKAPVKMTGSQPVIPKELPPVGGHLPGNMPGRASASTLPPGGVRARVPPPYASSPDLPLSSPALRRS